MAINELEGKPIPCPLCSRQIKVRISKSGKPYLVCDDCGMQLFIRYLAGIKRLMDMITGELDGWFK